MTELRAQRLAKRLAAFRNLVLMCGGYMFLGYTLLAGQAATLAPPATAGGKPAFDAATVKRQLDPNAPMMFSAPAPGRARLLRQTVRSLLFSAYQVQDYQVIGGPEWLATDRYDVEATAEGGPAAPQMLIMVRTLLADRFKLVMHTESRELPIYRLVFARMDRQLGPQLRPTNCKPAQKEGINLVGGPGICGNWGSLTSIIVGGNTIKGLANQLGRRIEIGRPVVDETRLSGVFDWELRWSADPRGDAVPPQDVISIFTAVQEQLGLKLEAGRGPVDVYVIDSVERPTDN